MVYYYDIDIPLLDKPNYSKYYIVEFAEKGDVIFETEGSGGIEGHAAIVEGRFYDSTYGYYVRLVESIDAGVRRGFLDATRAEERGSYLCAMVE